MHKFPLVWGHRGSRALAPENTLLSFKKSIEDEADGIELDIQLTKDREIVICHDETIDRTSDAKGWLKDYTLEELKRMNFNQDFPELGKQEIPTMREVFELIQPTELTIDIELKTSYPYFYEGMEEMILEMSKDYGMEDRVNYSSFNHYTCKRIVELKPDADVGLLYFDGTMDLPLYAKKNGFEVINPAYFNLFLPNARRQIEELGLKTRVWTVNEEEEVRACIERNVEAIITDNPKYIRNIYQKIENEDKSEKNFN
ncbi:MAG: hypothetical protein IJ875_00025 [Solobacterium sp.]|nr:hypothetical protein [Solobacterium sp.]